MRRSSPLCRVSVRSAAVLTGPLALLAFASMARAETVPVPSPGPSFVPLTAPSGAGVSLSAALIAAAVVALFALVIVVTSRRRRGSTVATGRVAPQPVTTDRSGDRSEGNLTSLPEDRRAEEEKRRPAA